jgi:rhodanese-related sulfurtransferase
LCIVISIITAIITSSITISNHEPSDEQLIKEFYTVETLTMVSPHHIRKHMDDGNFVLVDLRSEEEYLEDHIKGAINIPAYSDRYTSAYGEVERIVSAFSKISEDKDIIVYCYSIPCMTGRKVAKVLADNEIYVKHLGIGWNEWKYHWTLWNHEHEWEETNVEDYIESGEGIRVPTEDGEGGCPAEGIFSC